MKELRETLPPEKHAKAAIGPDGTIYLNGLPSKEEQERERKRINNQPTVVEEEEDPPSLEDEDTLAKRREAVRKNLLGIE